VTLEDLGGFWTATEARDRLGMSSSLIVQTGFDPDHVGVFPAVTHGKLAKMHLWDMPARPRGLAAEDQVAQEIRAGAPHVRWLEEERYNHETIDLFDDATKTITSVKSIDPQSKTYQTPSRFEYALKKYVQTVAGYAKDYIGQEGLR